MLIELPLLGQFPKLTHVLNQKLGNAIGGHWVAGLRLECIANRSDDTGSVVVASRWHGTRGGCARHSRRAAWSRGRAHLDSRLSTRWWLLLEA